MAQFPTATVSDLDQTARVSFSHPAVAPNNLYLHVNPNNIQWSYKLNTANYPTYGGEVVQILSCFIDDMTISGSLRSYEDLERVYRWFHNYVEAASQAGGFNQTPVTFNYAERLWTFTIIPKQLPSFKYGRDVVSPEWQITASVAEPDRGFQESLLNDRIQNFITNEGVELFGTATAQIGFTQDDPFSGPVTMKDGKAVPYTEDQKRSAYGDLGDKFNKLIPSYLNNDFKDISASYSRPAFLAGSSQTGGPTGQTNTGTPTAKRIAQGKK